MEQRSSSGASEPNESATGSARLSEDAERYLLARYLKNPYPVVPIEKVLERLFGWSEARQLELRKELVLFGFIEPEREQGSEGFT